VPDPDWLFPVGLPGACGFIDVAGREVLPRRFVVDHICFKEGFPRNGLFPVEVQGKRGYVDAAGTMVIPPRYDWAYFFSDGLASVGRAAKHGSIDRTGREVVPLESDFANMPVREGLAAVSRASSQGPWGYVDTSGRFVIPHKYRNAGPFAEGLAVVWTEAGWAVIDKVGKEVIPEARVRKLYPVGWFADGRLRVTPPFDPKQLLPGATRPCGYLDRAGNVAMPLEFESECGAFSEGLAAVTKREPPWGGKRGYIDVEGRIVLAPRFDDAGEFAGGLAPVRQGRRWGFIDRRGQWAIAPRFLSAASFSHGLAMITTADGEPGYVDPAGKLVWPRPRTPPSGRVVGFFTVAEASSGGGAGRQFRKIESQAEMDSVWAGVHPTDRRQDRLPDIARHDYALAASGYPQGAGVHITRVTAGPLSVTVEYDEVGPGPCHKPHFVPSILTSPFHLIRLPRQNKPYLFDGRVVNSCLDAPP
jgi:hypothetical protein